MNKAQRLQKGLTVALITVLSLGIVSTVGKMLNDKYDWIEKAKDLFVKPGETSEDPITSEETPIETKLINVVVIKDYEITELEFFSEGKDTYIAFTDSGADHYSYDYEFAPNYFISYINSMFNAPEEWHYTSHRIESAFVFPVTAFDIKLNSISLPIYELMYEFFPDKISVHVHFEYFNFDGSDVLSFKNLENLSVDPTDILTDDDDRQYVLDVDGLTKLYLYQV